MVVQLADLLAELDDAAFERLYGPLARLRPSQGAELFHGFARPWWIVGGWAIEAATGRHRDHDDLDVSILASDVPALLAHFLASHHVWVADGGTLSPVLSVDQELPPSAHQLWIRETATGPWLLDVIIAPERDGRWVFRRDPTVERELDSVTWLADDGLRYQRPEITLAFKAAHQRTKDTTDLQATMAMMSSEATAWLHDTIARLHPGHDWLDDLAKR